MSGTALQTRYGVYTQASKNRLDMLYDYESGTIESFFETADLLKVERMLDIGANIGAYAIYLSRISSIQRLDLFEPSPRAYEVVQANIALQEAPEKFVAHQLAASSEAGQAEFEVVSPLAGNSRLVENAGENSLKTIKVKTVPLDVMLNVKNQRLAVKIDVEGHEPQVLEGMRRLLAENHCLLQVECLNELMGKAVEKIMTLLGYKKAFVLNSDYIFIAPSFISEFDAIQNIYFKNLRKPLAELVTLRQNNRANCQYAVMLLNNICLRDDPVLKDASK